MLKNYSKVIWKKTEKTANPSELKIEKSSKQKC